MYSYRPPHKNKIGVALSMALLAIAAILIVTSSLFPDLRSIPQILGLVLALVSVMVMTRFVLRVYEYDIEDSADGYEFTIYEIQSKRRKTVCRIGFTDITELGEAPERDSELRERFGVEKSYSYCPDIRQTGKYYIAANINDKTVLVIFAPDADMVNAIRKCLAEMKDFSMPEGGENSDTASEE